MGVFLEELLHGFVVHGRQESLSKATTTKPWRVPCSRQSKAVNRLARTGRIVRERDSCLSSCVSYSHAVRALRYKKHGADSTPLSTSSSSTPRTAASTTSTVCSPA